MFRMQSATLCRILMWKSAGISHNWIMRTASFRGLEQLLQGNAMRG